MTEQSYDYLVKDIYSCIDLKELDKALHKETIGKRHDSVMDVIRDAVAKSTLGEWNNRVYFFNGRHYEPVNFTYFGNAVYDAMKMAGVPLGSFGRMDNIVRLCNQKALMKHMTVNNSIVSFRNCILDIETGKTFKHGREFVVFNSTDYDYDPKATGYLWEMFINDVMPHKAYQRLLKEFLGALFVDRHKVKIENMLILVGSGANGKSVIFETVSGILGHDNVTNYTLKDLVGIRASERKHNIAHINGKRLNYASETQHAILEGESAVLKSLISGEPADARELHGHSFMAYDIPLLMANTNILPNIPDFSVGMRRRVLIIPFDVEIPKWKQNPELAVELKKEYSAIFNWIYEGYQSFVLNKYRFTNDSMIEGMVDKYHSQNSTTLQFMITEGYKRQDELLRDSVPYWVQSKSLYSEYAKWCIANDTEKETYGLFASTLKNAGYVWRRHKDGIRFALYGHTALQRQTKILMYEHAAKEMEKAPGNEHRHFDARKIATLARKVMREHGWKRCAVGFYELQEYLGYRFDTKRHLLNGKLSGMYVMERGVYYFNLDKIDSEWRPAYERGIKLRENRKELDKQYNKMIAESTPVREDLEND